MAAIEVGGNSGAGAVAWQNTLQGATQGGQANAITFGDSDSQACMVAGSDSTGTHLLVIQYNLFETVSNSNNQGTPNIGWGDSNGFGGHTGKVLVPNSVPFFNNGSVQSATATAIMEPDGTNDEDWVIGGTMNWCSGSGGNFGSDFMLVDLNTDGSYHTSFNSTGIIRENFGIDMGSCFTPSLDSEYALVETQNASGDWCFTAVGSSRQDLTYPNKFALARYLESNGAKDTNATNGFGLLRTGGASRWGFAFGPEGTPYAAVVDNTTNFQTVVAVGTVNTNDFSAVKFAVDGTLDTTFGNAGIYSGIDFGSTSGVTTDVARSAWLRSDGSILIGGYSYTTSTNGKIALAAILDSNQVVIS